jgi:hypothetical protein
MALSLKDWEVEADKLGSVERMELIQAINTLNKWPAFSVQYDWTGYKLIGQILSYSQDRDDSNRGKRLNPDGCL